MSVNEIRSQERPVQATKGAVVLTIFGLVGAADIFLLTQVLDGPGPAGWVLGSILLWLLMALLSSGFFSIEPNQARVLVLFGGYKGTVRSSGFYWGNPFYKNGATSRLTLTTSPPQANVTAPPKTSLGRNKISLRARTLNGERLKVNDSRGNPIEIAAVVVWRVRDTAQAVFDVDDYKSYVKMQSESALRHLASQYAYDEGEGNEITLRGHVEEVSLALKAELADRLEKAGVVVDEARLTHLAYSSEIAQVMLRRQAAEAVIAARGKIVHGAVSMVHMALQELSDKGVVNLDDERRAAMVSNLMVVLCGESEVHPVVNAGTLYN